MRQASNLRLLGATALSLLLVNGLGVDLRPQVTSLAWQLGGDRAEARSSAGRSRGGSFSRPSAPSGGGGGGSYGGGGYRSDPSYGGGGPVIVPAPYGGGYGGYGYSSGGGFGLILMMLLLGGGILPIVWIYLMQAARARRSTAGGDSYAAYGELDNDTVTVTCVQIALLAQARYIQEDLTQLTMNLDPELPEQRSELLRESVLSLLRAPENWTHVRSLSQTVKSREEAGRLFEQLSIQERSKFSSETLARIGGQVRRQTLRVPEDEGPASYIVVTLLIGSADDRPLIKDKIYSSEELQQVLQKLGGISSDYLMVFELMWSPQDASDSLTRDELLAEYPDLIQIA